MGQYERITGKTSSSINMFYITMGIVTFFILVNLGISKYKTADDRIEAAVKPAIENQTEMLLDKVEEALEVNRELSKKNTEEVISLLETKYGTTSNTLNK